MSIQRFTPICSIAALLSFASAAEAQRIQWMRIAKQVALVLVLAIELLMVSSDDSYAQQIPNPVHNAGELLLATESYAVYKQAPFNHPLRGFEQQFCMPSFGRSQNEVRIVIVHKVNPDVIIVADEQFRRQFQEEIFPTIRQHCANIYVVYIKNHVYGVRINHDGQEFSYGQQLPRGFSEHPLNEIYTYPESGQFRYEVRADNNAAGSRTYPSLAALRQTRGNEAAAARERAAAQETEFRRESRNGLEPSSRDLAISASQYLKRESRITTCPNLENMQWCQWSIGIWIRLRGGTKLSCQAIVVGQDYICEYYVDYECAVRSLWGEEIQNSPHCSRWTIGRTNALRTGVRRMPQGWVVYPLRR